MSFSVTVSGFWNTVSVGTLPLSLLASTFLGWEVFVALEAAFFKSFIRFVFTGSFSVTIARLWDTVTVGACPFGFWIAAAVFLIVEFMVSEATFGVNFVRVIGTLGFSITKVKVHDALAIGAFSFSFGVAATDFGVVERVLSETTLVIAFIRLISAL